MIGGAARVLLGAALVLAAGPAAGGERGVTIEKATIPWSELERLMAREPRAGAAPRAAPSACTITADVRGEVDGARAKLTMRLDIVVLQDHWMATPLLPAGMAVASAEVDAPEGRRGMLVRAADGVSFAADGGGRYVVDLEVEGALEPAARGRRLQFAPPALAGGRARVELRGGGRIDGRTAWRVVPGTRGTATAEAALGASGLDLVVEAAQPATEVGTVLEGLEAVTVVSLGGGGVTRVRMQASGGDEGELVFTLPAGARLWKAWVGAAALNPSAISRRETVRLPLRGAAAIELAYTFEAPPMGIRGRYRVELPRMPVPVRQARWELWLPSGLRYRETQAAMTPIACEGEQPGARTPLVPQGTCAAFSRAVLEANRAYVEGAYEQPL